MSIADVTAQIAGLGKAAGKTAKQIGALVGSITEATPVIEAAGETAKQAADPLKDLAKLMGEDFPKAANFFSESYKVLMERLQRGEITTDQALESLLAMERVLNQFGLKPGDSAGLDAWSRKLQEIIRALDRAKRRP